MSQRLNLILILLTLIDTTQETRTSTPGLQLARAT